MNVSCGVADKVQLQLCFTSQQVLFAHTLKQISKQITEESTPNDREVRFLSW